MSISSKTFTKFPKAIKAGLETQTLINFKTLLAQNILKALQGEGTHS